MPTSSRTTRNLALLAGALFAATAAVDIPHEQAQPFISALDYLLEVLFSLSLAASTLTALSLAGSARGRAAVAGWRCLAAGTGVLTVVTAATALARHDVLGPLFLLGGLGVLVGAVALLVVDLRRRLQPRGAGLLLLGAVLAMAALGDGYGLLPWAAAWFAVATLLAPARSQEVAVVGSR